MRFIDHVVIHVRSGNGGAGCVAFRREKFEPHGGPAGGDGGRGGSVLIEADAHLNTLLDYRYQRHQYAQSGRPGEGKNRSGKDGADLVLRVPCGTLVKDKGTGTLLGEVVEPGQRLQLVKGGQGGRGNTRFKSATRQAPRYAQPGERGEEKKLVLELKMLADVGLVGLPNAGKSSLVASISAARPKIAAYPFTTLVPVPGIVQVGEFESFVIADIPGIIQGASQGKGLGLRFLRHIERNAVLLIMIPVDSDDPKREFQALMKELKAHDPALVSKPRLVTFSKADLLPTASHDSWMAEMEQVFGKSEELLLISSVSEQGLPRLRQALWARIIAERARLAS